MTVENIKENIEDIQLVKKIYAAKAWAREQVAIALVRNDEKKRRFLNGFERDIR